jgi:ribose transport system substrate-binding protein
MSLITIGKAVIGKAVVERKMYMKKHGAWFIIMIMVTSAVFGGGNQEVESVSTNLSGIVRELAPDAVIAGTVNADEFLEDGTKGVDAGLLTLSDQDKQKLKNGNYTAAIVLQVLDTSWAQQQIAGMKSVFDEYDVEIISVTGAQAKPEMQIENIENVIAMKPDVILSIPVDPSAEGPAYKRISENGIELILIDMIPAGLEHPRDYSSLISSSSYGNGVSAADIMASEFIEMGKSNAEVAVMKLNFSHFVTEERVRGFKERIEQYYPWIQVAAEVDFPYDMPKVTEISSGMLVANPDLNGAFVVWMAPAMSLVAAAREAGIDPAKFVITTVDLEEDGAMEIASRSYLKGTGAQDPFMNGVAEAYAGLRAILGYENPRFVAVPGYAVSKGNILEGYKAILGEDAPKQIVNAANR